MCKRHDQAAKRQSPDMKKKLRLAAIEYRKSPLYKRKRKQYLRKIRTRLSKANLAIDALTDTPSIRRGKMWDRRGRWAKEHDHCLECSRNLWKHEGKGLCVQCYNKFNYERLQEWYRQRHLERYRDPVQRELSKDYSRKYWKIRTLKLKKLKTLETKKGTLPPEVERILEIPDDGVVHALPEPMGHDVYEARSDVRYDPREGLSVQLTPRPS